jgi:hypothetical protein
MNSNIYKEKYVKYKEKYIKYKKNIQQEGGNCPDDFRDIAYGAFNGNCTYLISGHATKHIDSMGIECHRAPETIEHYVIKALAEGSTSDGRSSEQLFNIETGYKGSASIEFFHHNTTLIPYKITGEWYSDKRLFRVFQFCKLDAPKGRCSYLDY